MMRIAVGLAIVIACLFSAPTADACLWDRETNSREVEFRRQYNSKGTESDSAPRPQASSNWVGWTLLVVGGLLGMAALGTGVGVGIAQTRKSA
jgi:hypothetical protein